MVDSFSETTSESWFSRIIGSIKSVLVGFVLFGASFVVLFWNEGRAVRTARSLEEGAGVVVSVQAASVATSNEGKLVHLSGEATTSETLSDADFGVSAKALKLLRAVEMYQWDEEKKTEEKKKLGGGTEKTTTYTYKKTWSERTIDSSDFKKPDGHQNPESFPVNGKTLVAKTITVGGFTLSEPVVSRLDQSEEIRIDGASSAALPAAMKTRVVASGNRYYMGKDPAAPAVGDVRIGFKAVRPATISLVARQVGNTFEAYPAQAGDQILLVKYGTLSADAMFKAAQHENAILSWILRGVGFFLMFLGLVMIFRPIAVFADVIPLVGTLLGAGIGIFAGLTAVTLSLVTIAVAWIFFRPVLGIGLLVLAVGGLAALISIGLKRRRARAELHQAPVAGRGAA
jgi:hypothetical protein